MVGGGAELPLAPHARAAGGGDRGGGRRRGVPPLTRADAGEAVRRALGRCCGARGGADPGCERVRGPGRGAGVGGDPTLSRPLGRKDRHPERDGAHRDRPEVGRRGPVAGGRAAVPGRPGAYHHSRAGVRSAVIQHIDVHAVLQETVSGVYTDLVTRTTGRVVREHIERTIAAAEPAFAIARMDFTGVGCIDYSCADEIVAKLLRARPAVLVLTGISDGHREAIEPVLAGPRPPPPPQPPDGPAGALGAPPAGAAPWVDPLAARRRAPPGGG